MPSRPKPVRTSAMLRLVEEIMEQRERVSPELAAKQKRLLAILAAQRTDFSLANHGSICLLTPRTPAAEEWAAKHLPEDAMTWGHAVVVEPRYVEGIVVGIGRDGLTVS